MSFEPVFPRQHKQNPGKLTRNLTRLVQVFRFFAICLMFPQFRGLWLVFLLEIGRQELRSDQLEFDLDYLGVSASVYPVVQSQRSALLWGILRDAYSILGFDRAVEDVAFEQLGAYCRACF